jgi:beta-N-acetylhexosaminidase
MKELAQLICFNPAGAVLTETEESFITRNRISSFILFARNMPDLTSARAMIERLHALAVRPLIAIDQEGGRVTRLPEPATHMPSAMALGASQSPELAFRAGQATARELRAMRINAVLAPVLDVNVNPANPVIGTRSFGESASLVTEFALAWMRGAQGAGVAACAKHFPGHGDTHVDSHAALPRIDKLRAELERVDLAPFRAALSAGVEMVMPGHLLMTALDSERPASLSRPIVTGLLRGELGFDGVVITDALDMDAVAAEYGIPGAATEAILAGCDLAVPIVEHEETLAGLQRAVADGRLDAEQVERSMRRIQRLRDKLAAQPAADPAWLGASAHRALAAQIGREAIRVDDRQHLAPLRELQGFFVVEFALGRATIAEGPAVESGKLLQRLRAQRPALDGVALPLDPDARNDGDVLARATSARGLIVAVRQARHFTSQQQLVRQLLAPGKPTVLVAMRDPYDLDLFPEARCTIAAFDDSPAMLDALASALVA